MTSASDALQEKLDAYKCQIDELTSQVERLLLEKQTQPCSEGALACTALTKPAAPHHSNPHEEDVRPLPSSGMLPAGACTRPDGKCKA